MSLTSDWLLVLGSALIFIASIGAVKFPDTLTRMAAVSKASTLGIGVSCLGGYLHFQSIEAAALLGTCVAFMMIAIPISSHLLGRVRMHSHRSLFHRTQRNDYLTDVQFGHQEPNKYYRNATKDDDRPVAPDEHLR